ncbi:protein translocase subunit SecD [candidate division KSB1 bacterium]|nr:protein translocase subunit SecD [candidate division KSB1 bacterium]
MQKNLLWKVILVTIFLVAAIYSLYPTFVAGPQKESVEKIEAELSQLIQKPVNQVHSILCGDIQTSATPVSEEDENLTKEEIEAKLRNDVKARLFVELEVTNQDTLRKAMDLALQLRERYRDYIRNDDKAIKRGLDLQGGTYLVSEVDIAELTRNLAHNRDSRFNEVFDAALKAANESKRNFLDVLREGFHKEGILLNRYYGEDEREDDAAIIARLEDQAKDAVNRAREILVNRIDQFGISEPTIQKTGDYRIIIELAGVQDIQRAKDIIGTTAQLAFQLEETDKRKRYVLDRLNSVLRLERTSSEDTLLAKAETDSTVADSLVNLEEQVSKDKTVKYEDLFGEAEKVATDSTRKDTTSLLVDENTYEQNPFTALMRILPTRGGRDLWLVPLQNIKAVDRVLNSPKIREEIPEDAEFLWGKDPETYNDIKYMPLYFVKKQFEITGEAISDARTETSSGSDMGRVGEASVLMRLHSDGAREFSKITGANIGRHLAVVLDKKVASAPVIREKIPHGRASIDGMSSIQEAKDLALVLRAGALPAPMNFIEERTVGPSLGSDSVKKGTLSAITGLIIVIVFMIFYYKLSGAIADFALLLNIIFLLAILSGFKLTLTLPGVAGIILTIGMAVDANVLIFERIREEQRSGKTVRTSIDNGYGRALITIVDANVTTFLTALILYQFGTGPLQGFAVTLMIGIIVSMFTAIFVTRIIFDFFTSRWAMKQLSI